MGAMATARGGVIALPVSSSSATEPLTDIQLEPLAGFESYGDVRLYVYDGAIVELMRYEQKHASWMYITGAKTDTTTTDIDVDIEPNGYLTMVTKVDPLFVALAILTGKSQGDMYEPKDNLLDDNNIININVLMHEVDMTVICDTKTAGDECYYRFSPDRARRWLDAKVCNVSGAVPRREAAALVAQYLPESWAVHLLDKYAPQEASSSISPSKTAAVSDAQRLALEAMQSDVQKENDAVAAADATKQSEPPKKKKKVPAKKPVAKSNNPITSFFKKK